MIRRTAAVCLLAAALATAAEDRAEDREAIRTHIDRIFKAFINKDREELEKDGKRNVSSGRATEMFVNRNGQWVNPGWHMDSFR